MLLGAPSGGDGRGAVAVSISLGSAAAAAAAGGAAVMASVPERSRGARGAATFPGSGPAVCGNGGFEPGRGVEAPPVLARDRRGVPGLGGAERRGGALARSLRVRGSATWCGGTRYGGGEGPRGRGVQQHPKGLGHRRIGLSACKGKIRISQFR